MYKGPGTELGQRTCPVYVLGSEPALGKLHPQAQLEVPLSFPLSISQSFMQMCGWRGRGSFTVVLSGDTMV